MRDIVVGMAGHIDHGKTTLVKYLTGIDTDTLPEEKTRGITINLGFTQIKFSDGFRASLIDVPGHEKFIKNMSAGVSGVDYLILVIACDDGIMPQTVEHFQIARLFGVDRGMIVLAKRDLVSDERYEKLKAQCREYFSATFLNNSPILPFSIRNSEDSIRLKDTLYKELKKIEILEDESYFRMDIDRVFTSKGFGSVVTGTIKSGSVKIDDVFSIYPQNKKIRVKVIESHGEKREKLNSGNRCALNITGIDIDEIRRGNIVASSILLTDRIDCKLTTISTVDRIKNRQRIRLNIGTDEIIGRIFLYEKNYIKGEETCFAQLQLEKKIGVVLGEKGIVRNYSPMMTLGGIEVVFVATDQLDRNNSEFIHFLKFLSEKDFYLKIEELIKKEIEIDEIYSFVNKNFSLKKLLDEKKIYYLDKKVVHIENINKNLEIVIDFLEKFHIENRLEKGIVKSKIKDIFFKNYTFKAYNEFLNLPQVNEKIVVIDDYLALKDFKIRLNKDEKNMKEEIFSYYKTQKFQIYPYSYYLNLTKNKNLFEIIHRYMKNEKFIEYLEDDNYILMGFLKESIKIIKEYLENNEKISVKEARELLNNDRDSAILILRKLDSLRITKNINGIRVLYK